MPLLGEHGLEPVGRWVAAGAVPLIAQPLLLRSRKTAPSAPAHGSASRSSVVRAQLVAAAARRRGRRPSSGRCCGCCICPSSTSARRSTASAGKRCCARSASSRSSPAPAARRRACGSIWIWRWTLFRLMFGAGLIKLRGDPCWRDLTCLDYYFETQPMPNPLSWYFHWMPHGVHAGRRRVQPLRRTRRAVRVLRAAAVRLDRRHHHDPVSGRADRVRQSLVAELADDRALHSADQRPVARVAAGASAGRTSPPRRRFTCAMYVVAAVVALLSIAPVIEHAVVAAR